MAGGPNRAQMAPLSSDTFTASHPQQKSELTLLAVTAGALTVLPSLCTQLKNNVNMRMSRSPRHQFNVVPK